MALGGLLNARKVAETMSKRITAMNHGQGFTANLTTAILVVFASLSGLPVSTTHVSVGSLFGIGLTTGQANLRVINAIVLSWLVTLPCAAVFAGTVYSITIQNPLSSGVDFPVSKSRSNSSGLKPSHARTRLPNVGYRKISAMLAEGVWAEVNHQRRTSATLLRTQCPGRPNKRLQRHHENLDCTLGAG